MVHEERKPSWKWQDTEIVSLAGIFIARPPTIHPSPLPWVSLGSSICSMQRCPDSSCVVPEGVVSQDQPFLSVHSLGYFVMATRNDRHTGLEKSLQSLSTLPHIWLHQRTPPQAIFLLLGPNIHDL